MVYLKQNRLGIKKKKSQTCSSRPRETVETTCDVIYVVFTTEDEKRSLQYLEVHNIPTAQRRYI